MRSQFWPFNPRTAVILSEAKNLSLPAFYFLLLTSVFLLPPAIRAERFPLALHPAPYSLFIPERFDLDPRPRAVPAL